MPGIHFVSKPAAVMIRRFLFLLFLTASVPGLSQVFQNRDESLVSEKESRKPVRLNNRNFQKNLEKYAHQLDLTPKQIKKLNRIERKYSRKEAKLARKTSTKKRHLRALQKEKRERMIAVLDDEQQQKLQRLSKSGFWDFTKF